MSRAFTRELDDVPDVEEPLPPRPRDPHPITAAGHAALLARWQRHVDDDTTATREARIVRSILDSVMVKPASTTGPDAGFGCVVTIEDEDGRRRRYTLVGPDEADPRRGLVGIGSPLGRALRGKQVGDDAVIDKPGGEANVVVVAIEVADDIDHRVE